MLRSEPEVLERREFLTSIGRLALVASAGLAFTGCGSTDTTDDGDGFTVTSSLASGHTHAIFVVLDDLSSPPSNGVSYQSTATNAHFHVVVLTKAQLTSIDEGAVLTVTSTVSDGHQHAFSIQKP